MNGAERARIGAILLALLLAIPAGVVVADSLTHSATAGVTYETNSGVEVTLGDDRDVSATPFQDGETFADGDLTVSGSDAQLTAGDDAFDGDPITVQAVDVDGSLTADRGDLDRQFTVESGDANLLQVRDYEVDSGSEDLAYASDNGLTITLDGFDPIGIAAVDADTGEPVADAAVGENGEATFELPSGQRSIRLEATPSHLEVRNEAEPDELIDDDNVTLRARLFANDDVVIEREVTDGTVSLDGVPLDEELVITVREENADFTYRRILIDSAIQTSEIYLLPTTEPSAEVQFELRDDTGRFQSEDTRLFVEKPITRDFNDDGEATTRYQTITGDRVGADGGFPTILVDSERYRLRVENDDGEQRVLGSYTVQGAQVSTLPIGQVEFRGSVDDGAAMQASLQDAADDADHHHEVRLTYVDPEAETEEIDIQIVDGDGSEIRPSSTEEITGSEPYVETFPIEDLSFNPEEDTATVTVEAERGFEVETFEQPLGDVPDVLTDMPISETLLTTIGLVSLVALVGLLVLISAPMAAVVGAGYAGLLTLTGVVPIPMPAVVLAGLIGILASVGTQQGVIR